MILPFGFCVFITLERLLTNHWHTPHFSQLSTFKLPIHTQPLSNKALLKDKHKDTAQILTETALAP